MRDEAVHDEVVPCVRGCECSFCEMAGGCVIVQNEKVVSLETPKRLTCVGVTTLDGRAINLGRTAMSPAMSVDASVGQCSRDVGSGHWYVSNACDGQWSILPVALLICVHRWRNPSATDTAIGRYLNH